MHVPKVDGPNVIALYSYSAWLNNDPFNCCVQLYPCMHAFLVLHACMGAIRVVKGSYSLMTIYTFACKYCMYSYYSGMSELMWGIEHLDNQKYIQSTLIAID